uniref:Uncharacterized protein n=1 Tax=Podospora anserina TaxID=2587412 RepID=Q35361_PODAS|nr:unknown [Podospora anserina]
MGKGSGSGFWGGGFGGEGSSGGDGDGNGNGNGDPNISSGSTAAKFISELVNKWPKLFILFNYILENIADIINF